MCINTNIMNLKYQNTENQESYYEEAWEALNVVIRALESKDAELIKSVLADKTI